MAKNIVSNAISPKLHRYLYNYSIKRFLEDNFKNINKLYKKYNVSPNNKMSYSRLLDEAIYNKDIDDKKVDEFLIKELSYGRAKNVYVSFLHNVSHLKKEENIIKLVHNLDRSYKNSSEVENYPFLSNIRRGIQKGDKQLIYFNLQKDNSNQVKNIEILLAENITNENEEECNNYIGVEINTELKMLVIKLRNWNTVSEKHRVDKLHDRVKYTIEKAFNLSITLMTKTSQQIVYNMINDLSYKVLDKATHIVDKKLDESIQNAIKDWSSEILSGNTSLPIAEVDVMKQSLLNSFYRVYMQNEIGELKVGTLRDKFNVDGYARYVKFVDDTISEGRARSSDPKECLLDTSIFYDIKARLDQAKQIKMATVYWISDFKSDHFGVTFYTETQERFKFIVLDNFFSKEICDYVLRQIEKYRPTTK